MTALQVDNNVKLTVDPTITGTYRMVDVTPEPEYSKEDWIKYGKKVVAASIILFGSVFIATHSGPPAELKAISYGLISTSAYVLLNGQDAKAKASKQS